MQNAQAVYPSLAGRVVFVTGGGSGIGAAIVAAFARQQAAVAFVDVDETASAGLQSSLKSAGLPSHYEPCDVRDTAALRDAIAKARQALGPISILINNAARDDRHVNLKHQFFAAQAVLPDMKAANWGSIINFGSSSWMVGQGGMVAYTAAKSAVLGLTRSLARDFGAYNIRVNAIAPGWILTERQRKLWLTPEAKARLLEAQCLKRELNGQDIARVVLFLASDEAAAITGQHYVVDAGRL
jgi:NAD(P)-dependent dehydrogenase (short-subunit alcohol dehydrogenase family)